MNQRPTLSQKHTNHPQKHTKSQLESNALINKLKMQSNNHNSHDTRPNNKILIRKNRNKMVQDQPIASKSMRKTMNHLSNRSPVQLNSSSNHLQMTYRYKQKFIDTLQSRIINNNQKYQAVASKDNQMKFGSTRYHNHIGSNSFRINLSKQKSKEINCVSAEPKQYVSQRAQNHMASFRSRSRTMTKEQQLSMTKIGETHKQLSKTIEVDIIEQKEKMHKSLIEIQKYEKISLGRQTKEVLPPNYHPFVQEEIVLPINISRPQEAILELDSTVHVNNTQTYQKQLNVLTKDFFQEWEKMNSTKSKLYKNLRKKMVSIFPKMKKHYQQYKQCSASMDMNERAEVELKHRKSIEELISLTFKSDKGDNLITSNRSISNNPQQTKDYQQKIRQFHQEQLLRDIFKQAYFWSRTKNKFMTNNFQQAQQAERQQMRNLKKIQTKLTFIHYMKSKNNKSQILNNRNKIKGSNIMKNKDSILEIEKQGSKQQQFLKRCLENAIQNCIKENQ